MEKKYKMRVYPMGFNGVIKDKVLNNLKELRQALRMALQDKLQYEILSTINELTKELGKSTDFRQIERVFNFAKTLNNIIEYSEDKFEIISDFINKMMLTEEEIAVIFAQTSRSPESFDVNAFKVTQEKAADFHRKWTLTVEGYGHSSIAEHAVLHLAIEKISTLACDKLEESRLVSFTEQSGRYQIIAPGYYYKPEEIMNHPKLKQLYLDAHDACFEAYEKLLNQGIKYIHSKESLEKDPSRKQKPEEKPDFYKTRLRKIVTDNIKQLFGPSRLTNVGVTINARNMEYCIKKMLSSNNPEIQEVAKILKKEGLKITPTLIQYADQSKYLTDTNNNQWKFGKEISPDYEPVPEKEYHMSNLIEYDKEAENKLIAAFLYSHSGELYNKLYQKIKNMKIKHKKAIIDRILEKLTKHDIPIRSLEFSTDYLFEFFIPHGIYRELKRHRIMSYESKEDTIEYGVVIPDLIVEMNRVDEFMQPIKKMEQAYHQVKKIYPHLAGYLITRAHLKPMLCKFNLREAYHLVRLRTAPNAHHWIRLTFADAYKKMKKVHPNLWKYIKVSDKLLSAIKTF